MKNNNNCKKDLISVFTMRYCVSLNSEVIIISYTFPKMLSYVYYSYINIEYIFNFFIITINVSAWMLIMVFYDL